MKKENNYYKVNLLNMTNQILASKLLYSSVDVRVCMKFK